VDRRARVVAKKDVKRDKSVRNANGVINIVIVRRKSDEI
jgi:hypothetical protein